MVTTKHMARINKQVHLLKGLISATDKRGLTQAKVPVDTDSGSHVIRRKLELMSKFLVFVFF